MDWKLLLTVAVGVLVAMQIEKRLLAPNGL
jgi:hypothetical protein